MCILLGIEIIIKFKEPKVISGVLAIATSILGLVLSVIAFLCNTKEISSAIIMVVSSMIILSIPFYRIKSRTIKSEKQQ